MSKFGYLNSQQKTLLVHSLGNLLPLSRSKNSSLQNAAFELKKNNECGVGYYNGSISENEVNIQDDWAPKEIHERGITLLKFMENRWNIVLGDDAFKAKLLHVDKITLSPVIGNVEVVA
ncbi:HNH endonuclease family protein [Acinetobacter guillouiae]|uniref:HNH endonuclease family protein n=1 Tax=Acinetobacter guillouiae TaxID=106649 RepID=UPI003AF81947